MVRIWASPFATTGLFSDILYIADFEESVTDHAAFVDDRACEAPIILQRLPAGSVFGLQIGFRSPRKLLDSVKAVANSVSGPNDFKQNRRFFPQGIWTQSH